MTSHLNHLSLVSLQDNTTVASNAVGTSKLVKCVNLKANLSQTWENPGVQNVFVASMVAPNCPSSSADLTLPKNTAFVLGSKAKTFILQGHFKPFQSYKTRMSEIGLDLHWSKRKSKFQAAIMSLHALPPKIEAMDEAHAEAACYMNQTVQPLAFLGHTHDFGTKVAILNGESLLAISDPKNCQIFQPLTKQRSFVFKGDLLRLRCEYWNSGSVALKPGGSRKDEMCAGYLLHVFKPGPDSSLNSFCFGGIQTQ